MRDRAEAAGRTRQKLALECIIFVLYASLFITVFTLRRNLPASLHMTKAVEHALHAEIDPSSGDSAQVSPPWPSTAYMKRAGVYRRHSMQLRWDHDTAASVGLAAGPPAEVPLPHQTLLRWGRAQLLRSRLPSGLGPTGTRGGRAHQAVARATGCELPPTFARIRAILLRHAEGRRRRDEAIWSKRRR